MSVPQSLEWLRESLMTSVDALRRRCASEIPEPLIDRLVELDWLQWHGGGLRLTITGENIHRHALAQRRASEAAAGGSPDSTPALSEDSMATKPNYQFEKRQRELAKKKKKEEKSQRKATPSQPEGEVEPKASTEA